MVELTDILFSVVFLLIVLVVIYVDNLAYNRLITPFSVLALPIALIVNGVNFIAVSLEFIAIKSDGIFYLLLCLFFFRLPGVFLENSGVSFASNYDCKKTDSPYLITSSIIAIVLCLINFLISSRIHNWKIYTDEFGQFYGGGILGHIMQFSCALYFYLFLFFLKFHKKKLLPLIMSIFVFVFIVLIKYYIFLLFLTPLFYFIITKKVRFLRIIKLSIFVASSGLALFMFAYIVTFMFMGTYNINSMSEINNFILGHFCHYLFGPLISFTTEVSSSVRVYDYDDFLSIFIVPINLFKAFIGDDRLYSNVSHFFIPIAPDKYDNAGSIFSSGYRAFGYIGNLMFFFMIGTFFYFIESTVYKNKSDILYMLYSFLLSVLFLGFFGYYFNILSIYEIGFYIILCGFLLMIIPSIIKTILKRKLNVYDE